ncbi:MAG: TolC family protein [Chitinophagales bacterium]
MRSLFLFSVLYFITTILSAQNTWTLDRCIVHALENNIEIQQSDLNVEMSEINLKSAKANLLPGINADAGYNLNYGRSLDPTTYDFETQQIKNSNLSMSSGLDIFTGGNKINRIKQNQLNLKANRLLNKNVQNNIALQVTSAYLQILLARENLKTLEHQLDISLEQYRQTTKMYENGAVPEGNLLEVEAQMTNDTVNMIQAQNSLIISLLSLQQLLQIDLSEEFDIYSPDIEVSDLNYIVSNDPEEVYQIALGNQPIIESNTYAEMSAERAVKAAKGLYYPSIRLIANLRTNHSSLGKQQSGTEVINNPPIGYVAGSNETVRSFQNAEIPILEDAPFYTQYDNNFNQTVGISMSVPILNGLQTRYNVKNAQLQLEQQKLENASTRNQLKNDVYVAHNDARLAFQTYKARQRALDATQRSFEYVEKRFNIGAANLLEYTTAKTNYANAAVNLTSAKYDYILKTKVLDFYLGKPISLDE